MFFFKHLIQKSSVKLFYVKTGIAGKEYSYLFTVMLHVW